MQGVRRIATGILKGLDYLHREREIIHTDLKRKCAFDEDFTAEDVEEKSVIVGRHGDGVGKSERRRRWSK